MKNNIVKLLEKRRIIQREIECPRTMQDNMIIYTAEYWQNHFKAGLVFSGYDGFGEAEWVGEKEQWDNLENL